MLLHLHMPSNGLLRYPYADTLRKKRNWCVKVVYEFFPVNLLRLSG